MTSMATIDRAKLDRIVQNYLDGRSSDEEADFLELFARIAAGLVQLVDDVLQGQFADVVGDIVRDRDLFDDLDVADHLFQRLAEVRGDLFHQLIALGMHRGRVEWIVAATDA